MRSNAHSNRVKEMRKGTHSCKSCRSRKVRCIFPPGQSQVCVQCARRGDTCIPQRTGVSGNLRPTHAASAGLGGFETQRMPSTTGEEMSGTPQVQGGIFTDGPTRTWRSDQFHPFGRISSPPLREVHAQDPSSFPCTEGMRNETAPLLRLFNNSTLSPSDDRRERASVEGTNIATFASPPNTMQYSTIVEDLRSVIPSGSELKETFHKQSNWWTAWRISLDLFLGDEADLTLEMFAEKALSSEHPSLLGNLLVCLAISTDEYQRYLDPVERWILNDDELAGCLHGLRCSLGFGLVLVATMQPRRAVSVFRRANTLMQMNGIHRTHRASRELDSIFWQLFHADRWVHLMLGLPYSVPDILCDLHIPPIGPAMPPSMFHHRHFAILTGRTIDCLQDLNGCLLSRTLQIEEQMDKVVSHLPFDYLDLAEIYTCSEPTEKYMRLLRVRYGNQLKAFLHLPLFLQTRDRQGYSRKTCIDSSRGLLEAFLVMAENSLFFIGVVANLEAFSAFTSAVVLFLHSTGYGRTPEQDEAIRCTKANDERLILETLEAIKQCASMRGSSLSKQCLVSLQDLVDESRALEHGQTQTIVLPFFGKVSLKRKRVDVTPHDGKSQGGVSSNMVSSHGDVLSLGPEGGFDDFSMFEDIDLTYEGQWLLDDTNLFFPAT